MVKVTQFVTEDAERRSKMQNIPLLNSIFAYQSYAIGTGKAMGRIAGDINNAIQHGNTAQRTAAAKRLGTFIVAAGGAAMLSEILSRVVRGRDPFPDDETTGEFIAKSVWDIALLGPVQRLVDAPGFSNWKGEELIADMSPKLSALASIFNAIVGSGPKGKLGGIARMDEAAKRNISAYRALMNWHDRIAYPERGEADSVRRKVRRFERETLGQDSAMRDFQFNPDYYPVRLAVQNGDNAEAAELAGEYLRRSVLRDGMRAKDALDKLHESVMTGRPLSVAAKSRRPFLDTLPADEAKEAVELDRQFIRRWQSLPDHAINLSPEMRETWKQWAAAKGDRMKKDALRAAALTPAEQSDYERIGRLKQAVDDAKANHKNGHGSMADLKAALAKISQADWKRYGVLQGKRDAAARE
jgi:hypothetical protein